MHRRFLSQSVAAAMAIGALSAAPMAQATPNLGVTALLSRVAQCATAVGANETEVPACSTLGPNRYRAEYQVSVVNNNARPGATETPVPAEKQPATIQVAVDLTKLLTTDAGIAPVSWAVVGAPSGTYVAGDADLNVDSDNSIGTITNPTADQIKLHKENDTDFVPLTGNSSFNGGTDKNLLGSQTLPPEGTATITFAVEADFASATSFPSIVATLTSPNATSTPDTSTSGAGTTVQEKAFLPAKKAATPVGDGCPASTNAGTAEFVANGDFKTLHTGTIPTGGATSSATALLANSFFSDVRLANQGYDAYQLNKTISIVRHSSVEGYFGTSPLLLAQQHPLPGGTSDNWLRHGGGGDGQPQKFWRQKVAGLVPNRTYLFSAWVSNISWPGYENSDLGARSDPQVRLLQNSTPVGNAAHNLPVETATAGDSWTQIRGTFTASASEVELAIENTQTGDIFNQLGVTGISLRSCLGASDGDSTPVNTTPSGGSSSNGTIAGGSSSGGGTDTSGGVEIASGGGGGGAFGLGLLALLGLPVALRRRVRR